MSYGEEIILKDINFDVYEGEVFVILGGSGCGKSTLLKHLIGLYPPHAGKIFVDEEEINQQKDDFSYEDEPAILMQKMTKSVTMFDRGPETEAKQDNERQERGSTGITQRTQTAVKPDEIAHQEQSKGFAQGIALVG